MIVDEITGPMMLQPLKSQGVMRVEESALIFRMKFTAKPGEQWIVRRTAYTRVRDALAAAGMRFTAAYAGYTVCAPSRATFFTGRHSGRLAGAPADWPLLPQLLQAAGYETVAFGKSAPMPVWH